jgi:hypothetical protein
MGLKGGFEVQLEFAAKTTIPQKKLQYLMNL